MRKRSSLKSAQTIWTIFYWKAKHFFSITLLSNLFWKRYNSINRFASWFQKIRRKIEIMICQRKRDNQYYRVYQVFRLKNCLKSNSQIKLSLSKSLIHTFVKPLKSQKVFFCDLNFECPSFFMKVFKKASQVKKIALSFQFEISRRSCCCCCCCLQTLKEKVILFRLKLRTNLRLQCFLGPPRKEFYYDQYHEWFSSTSQICMLLRVRRPIPFSIQSNHHFHLPSQCSIEAVHTYIH